MQLSVVTRHLSAAYTVCVSRKLTISPYRSHGCQPNCLQPRPSKPHGANPDQRFLQTCNTHLSEALLSPKPTEGRLCWTKLNRICPPPPHTHIYGLPLARSSRGLPTRSIGPDDGREAPEGPDNLPPLVRFEVLDLDQLQEPHVAKARREQGSSRGRWAPTRENRDPRPAPLRPRPRPLKPAFHKGGRPKNLARPRHYIRNPKPGSAPWSVAAATPPSK